MENGKWKMKKLFSHFSLSIFHFPLLKFRGKLLETKFLRI